MQFSIASAKRRKILSILAAHEDELSVAEANDAQRAEAKDLKEQGNAHAEAGRFAKVRQRFPASAEPLM